MNKKVRKAYGGVLFLVGYILSPLSFWNDLLVNIPLAYLMTFWVGYFWPQLMLPAFILGYWITNLLGFVAMKQGADHFNNKPPEERQISWKKETFWVGVFTLIIFVMVQTGILQFPIEAPAETTNPGQLGQHIFELMMADLTKAL